jgi:hypothetical protein
MKKIFFCLALFIGAYHFATAQTAQIPEKWKNESVVILDQKLSINYRYGTMVLGGHKCLETISKSLKLQDKAAVAALSEFYFFESPSDKRYREHQAKKGKDESVTKITVIKHSGERVKVDISAAIPTERDNVPAFFRCLGFNNDAIVPGTLSGFNSPFAKYYKKIAIPNLEIGDILSYESEVEYRVAAVIAYNASSSSNYSLKYAYFPPYHAALAAIYPILKQEIEFIFPDKFYINANTYNGAPKFTVKKSGIDYNGKVSDKVTTYKMTSENTDRIPKEIMSFATTYLPTVKFQIVDKPVDNSPTDGNFFLDGNTPVQVAVLPNDVARQFNIDFRAATNDIDISKFNEYIKRYNLTQKSFDEQVKMTFAYVKVYHANEKKVRTPNQTLKDWYLIKYGSAAADLKDFYFAAYMSKCFDKLELQHEVLAVMPRSIGKLSDLLLGAEVTWVARVTDKKKTYDLFPMNAFTTSDENQYPYLYGAQAYVFRPSDKKKDKDVAIVGTQTTVASPSPSNQTYHAKLRATFDEQLDKLSVNRTVACTGSFKSEITPFAMLGIDFDDIYEQRYTLDTPEKIAKNKTKAAKKSKAELAEAAELEVVRKELLEKQKEYMKKELANDYDDIDTYDAYQTIAPGITEDSSTLIYNEQFKLNNMLAKAGRNYTLEIGKICSKEPKLDDDDRKPRQADIEVWFPRTIINEVELTLPSGYTIEDLRALNFVVDNDLMHFEVVSTLAADKLSVKTTKIYKVTSAPKTEFPKIVDVFEKVYDFSQQKIVLKKL